MYYTVDSQITSLIMAINRLCCIFIVYLFFINQSLGNSVIEFDQESGMFLGRGYDTVGGVVKGDCVERVQAQIPGNTAAVRTTFSLSKAESYYSLSRSTGVSVSASFAGGMLSASGKASFIQNISVNDYSLYILAQVKVDNATSSMLDSKLKSDAYELLRDKGSEAFSQRCGDSFISGYTTGGELYSVIVIKTGSESEKRAISAELGGSYGAFSASGAFSEAISRISERNDVDVYIYKTGAASVVQITPDKLIEEAVQFPTNVSGVNAYIYKATITPYNNIPLPAGKDVIDIVNKLEVTEKLSEYRLDAYQNLANIEYILKYPDEFIDPDMVSLSKAAAQVKVNVNEIVRAARVCARSLENCTLPTDFSPPSVILPKRKLNSDAQESANKAADEARLESEARERRAEAEIKLREEEEKSRREIEEAKRRIAELDRIREEALRLKSEADSAASAAERARQEALAAQRRLEEARKQAEEAEKLRSLAETAGEILSNSAGAVLGGGPLGGFLGR